MTRLINGLLHPLTALRLVGALGVACAVCRVVPVDRRGETCSPTCWSQRGL